MRAIRQRTQAETEELKRRYKVEQEGLRVGEAREEVSPQLSSSLSESFLEDFLGEVLGAGKGN